MRPLRPRTKTGVIMIKVGITVGNSLTSLKPALGLSLAALGLTVASPAHAAGACDQNVNPHSFACQDAAFNGQTEFALVNIDWANHMQGEWFATTFVSSTGQMSGDGFVMDVNPVNPRKPGRGVLNTQDSSAVASMFISGAQIGFPNWHGLNIGSAPVQILDSGTVQIQFNDNVNQNLYQCRMFLRGGADHLTCKWFILDTQRNQWRVAGYFGFLTRAVWDAFVASGGAGS